jgi:hypothetical protein
MLLDSFRVKDPSFYLKTLRGRRNDITISESDFVSLMSGSINFLSISSAEEIISKSAFSSYDYFISLSFNSIFLFATFPKNGMFSSVSVEDYLAKFGKVLPIDVFRTS